MNYSTEHTSRTNPLGLPNTAQFFLLRGAIVGSRLCLRTFQRKYAPAGGQPTVRIAKHFIA